MDQHHIKNHYATLGLQKNASTDEIRKAFQQLAKELHPDINPSPAAATQFSAVKEAYDVLRDSQQKLIYDKTLEYRSTSGYDPEELRRRAEHFRRTHQHAGAGAGGGAAGAAGRAASGQMQAMRIVEQLLRPRMLLMVPAVAALSWWLMSLTPQHTYEDVGDRVKAWYNPRTQQWETPAPWDPAYESHKHTTMMIPRGQVQQAAPPTAVRAAVAAATVSPTSSSGSATAAAVEAGPAGDSAGGGSNSDGPAPSPSPSPSPSAPTTAAAAAAAAVPLEDWHRGTISLSDTDTGPSAVWLPPGAVGGGSGGRHAPFTNAGAAWR